MDGLLGEGEGLDEAVLGDLIGGALDHEHVGLGADVDEVERAGEHLLDGGVRHELAVDLGDADGTDGAVPRDVGDGEGGGAAVEHEDIGLIDLVGGEEQTDDLDLVEETFREKRAAGTVA